METKPVAKCPNCGHIITCGCQRAKSISGKACCKYCVAEENKKFRKEQIHIKPNRRSFLP